MKENMLMANGMEKENNIQMKVCLEQAENQIYYMKENLKMANGMETEKNIESVW